MEWISVKDRQPEDYEYILINVNVNADAVDGPLIFVGSKNGHRFESAWGDGWTPFKWEEVTHWMPLPEVPNE